MIIVIKVTFMLEMTMIVSKVDHNIFIILYFQTTIETHKKANVFQLRRTIDDNLLNFSHAFVNNPLIVVS